MAQPKPKLTSVEPAQPPDLVFHTMGRVMQIDATGNISVDIGGKTVVAALATHVSSPMPGQRVVVMQGSSALPLISAAYPLETSMAALPDDSSDSPHKASSAPALSYDPATGTLSIHAKQLNLQGMSAIEIRCGDALLRFNAQGEVFMQAEAITQSAIGPYQIEGASIDLN